MMTNAAFFLKTHRTCSAHVERLESLKHTTNLILWSLSHHVSDIFPNCASENHHPKVFSLGIWASTSYTRCVLTKLLRYYQVLIACDDFFQDIHLNTAHCTLVVLMLSVGLEFEALHIVLKSIFPVNAFWSYFCSGFHSSVQVSSSCMKSIQVNFVSNANMNPHILPNCDVYQLSLS